jgi:hypothetical protein
LVYSPQGNGRALGAAFFLQPSTIDVRNPNRF